jgi:FtsP/CotA-like multicopper oxidase with cupredoxin domain
MQFRVTQAAAADTSWNPAAPTEPLRPAMVRLANAPAVKRQMTLNEVMGMPTAVNGIAYPGGPLEILVNNTKWSGESSRPYQDFEAVNQNGIVTHYSEVPQEGQLELWEFINLTADAHPMHTHLTQFQILNRQAFDVAKYTAAYDLAFPGGMGLDVMTGMEMMYPPNVYVPTFGPPLDYNVANLDGALGGNPAVKPFLKGPLRLPAANELGWKDTILTPPGMVTRILVRYAPMDTPASTAAADAAFPFSPMDAQDPYGYVWHCHIVDHEDNEMMRPLLVKPNLNPAVVRTIIKGVDY